MKHCAKQKDARRGDLALWPLVRWISLAAARELVGASGEKAAQEAANWILPASKGTKWSRGRIELVSCAMGVLSYFDEQEATEAWRLKLLHQKWSAADEAAAFQITYLSSLSAADDDLVQLAQETAYVCAMVIDGLPNQHTAPLVLGLTRHARARHQHVGEALTKGARALSRADSISVGALRFGSAKRGGEAIAQITLDLGGSGRLEPLSFLFPQLTGGFARCFRSILVSAIETGTSGRAVLAALATKNGALEVVVRYDSRRVQVPIRTQDGLKRRFAVAVEHARALEARFHAKATLEFLATSP